MNLEKYLQLGSIVLLKDAKKRMMIIGYEAVTGDDGTTYDYIGCLYPEGVIEAGKHLLFNHDQIEEIYFSGYSDIEDQEFKVELKKLVEARDKTVDDAPRPFANIDSTSNEVDLY